MRMTIISSFLPTISATLYDKLAGTFAKMVYKKPEPSGSSHGVQYLEGAPTDNDRNIKREWMKAQYDRIGDESLRDEN